MLELVFTDSFRKEAKKLPSGFQNKLAQNLELLRENPFHPLLHVKRLAGALAGFYSFRITRDWRVIFSFSDEETIKLIDIGHRRDIYR